MHVLTCSRCGVVQTVKSIKRHFPQCSGSPNLRTSVNNDTLASSIDQEDFHSDSMVNNFSEPEINHDFVRGHLSVTNNMPQG
jgi:hypothetical protein